MLYAETRANVRHLSADVFWFGVLAGSTMAFLAIFAARQGATGFEVSLLTAGPAVINLFFSLQAGRWLEGKPLIRITYIASLLTRLGYLVLIPLPWFLAARQQVEAGFHAYFRWATGDRESFHVLVDHHGNGPAE